MLYRSSSSESQWQPKVLWVPAGQADESREGSERNRGGEKGAREETVGQDEGLSYRKGQIWAALQRRRYQAGKSHRYVLPLVRKVHRKSPHSRVAVIITENVELAELHRTGLTVSYCSFWTTQTPRKQRRLFCRFYDNNRHPYYVLGPVKQEDEWDQPRIVRFHDIISEREMEKVKEMAKPRVSSTRSTALYQL